MAISFEGEIRTFDNMSRAARGAINSLENLPFTAEDFLLAKARSFLLNEARKAAGNKREYGPSNPELYAALVNYFAQSERVTIVHDGEYPTFQVHTPDPEESQQRWDEARQMALEMLELTSRYHSPEWKQQYWRAHVWGHRPTYDLTIDLRLFITEHDPDDSAPFWGFLEEGSGEGAYPFYQATGFVARARATLGSTSFSKKYLNPLIAELSGSIGDIIRAASNDGGKVAIEQIERQTTATGERAIIRRHGYGGRFIGEDTFEELLGEQ